MIVPQFRLDQDEKFVLVYVKAPMANIKDTQVEFDQQFFLFWSKPYHLRLQLPGPVVANGEEHVKWNVTTNEFHIKLPKLNEGEHFEELGMLTKLMTVKPPSAKNFVSPEVVNAGEAKEKEEEEEEEEFDWLVEQDEWTQEKGEKLLGEKYGFADRYSGILARFEDEIADLVDVKSPEVKSFAQRREERMKMDAEKFDEEHYWSDLFDQADTIDYLIKYKAPWESPNKDLKFNDEEIFRLKNLPKREYILTRREKFELLLGLTDILFAYAYDVRTTEGEHSCESGWTISKLSSTLCWLEKFSSLNEALITSVQRSLIYPLYRNWNLSIKVVEDVREILENGRVYVLKCLLNIHRIFNEGGDLRYLFNELFLTDYCVWLQTVKEKTYLSLADCTKKITIKKSDLNIDLELVEKAAALTLAEDSRDGERLNISSTSESDSSDDDKDEKENVDHNK